MSDREWQRFLTFQYLLVACMVVAACDSSNSVPEPADAMLPPDAAAIDATVCACPGTELLSRQHLSDVWEVFSPNNDPSDATLCEMMTDLPIGGGCRLSDLTDGGFLTYTTRPGNAVGVYPAWSCGHVPFLYGSIEVLARCVRPLDRAGEVAEGCECPPIETPVDRISFVPQALTVPRDEVGTVTSRCPEGSTLIGGTCSLPFIYGGALLRQSPDPADPQGWRCTWHASSGGTIDGEASAICLAAPGPDAVTGESVPAEIVARVLAEDTLPANGTRIVEATCAPGDTLLTGGCHVDEITPELITDLRLMVTSPAEVEDNRPNTYQCAWRNSTTLTPTVFTTAICLKPPAAE